jgi:hypothetical protein
MEDATTGRSRITASEDIIATFTILYEVTASIKDAKKNGGYSSVSLREGPGSIPGQSIKI